MYCVVKLTGGRRDVAKFSVMADIMRPDARPPTVFALSYH